MVPSAAGRLRANFRSDAVEGEFGSDRVEAQASVYYYWLTAATALDLLGSPVIETPRGEVIWTREIAAQLVERQRLDGSWHSVAAGRKENLATIADMIALPALAICRKHLIG